MGEMVTFASNGSEASGYLALPADGGSGPGVVLIQEWWGLVPHITDVADRLAAEGFVTLAPDLYHGESTTEPDEAAKKLMALDRERASQDIAGAADYLADRQETSMPSVGTIGFCMGGSLAVWSAQASDLIRTIVAFYPAMPWEGFVPDRSSYAGRQIQMHLDEHEGGVGEPNVSVAADALLAAGAEVEMFEYPATGHAFFNDTRPKVYDADAAALAWSRSVAFLREFIS